MQKEKQNRRDILIVLLTCVFGHLHSLIKAQAHIAVQKGLEVGVHELGNDFKLAWHCAGSHEQANVWMMVRTGQREERERERENIIFHAQCVLLIQNSNSNSREDAMKRGERGGTEV